MLNTIRSPSVIKQYSTTYTNPEKMAEMIIEWDYHFLIMKKKVLQAISKRERMIRLDIDLMEYHTLSSDEYLSNDYIFDICQTLLEYFEDMGFHVNFSMALGNKAIFYLVL